MPSGTTKTSKKKGGAAAAAAAAAAAGSIPVVTVQEIRTTEMAGATVEAATVIIKTKEEVACVTTESSTGAPVSTAAAAAPKRKSSAAKKPVKVVAVVTPDGIEGSFTPEPRRPLIAHLQIRPNDVVFQEQMFRYDPNPPTVVDPQPYNAADANFFTEGQEEISGGEEELGGAVAKDISLKEEVAAVNNSLPEDDSSKGASGTASAATVAPAAAKAMACFTKADLMVQFRDSAESKRLPDSTSVACFWCAHNFDWRPCVIPEREVNAVYNVYGNFCSPNCAVAFLLAEGVDPHVRWERVALLHRIYDREGRGRIFPAPARESLQLFGGPMSIDTFRMTSTGGKVRVDLHMPPMVSILGSIDTKPIDFFDTNTKLTGGSGGPSFPQRSVEEGLRLKRSKPLKDRESTLDSVMNIKIKGGKRIGDD